MRPFLIAILALALLAPTAAAQGDSPQHPPTLPGTPKARRSASNASRFGSSFRVFLVKGKRRISCKRARKIVAQSRRPRSRAGSTSTGPRAGNGPWSDVYYRHDHKVVVGAILRDV